MKFIIKFFLIFLVFLFVSQTSKAEQVLKYANIDRIIKETKIGINMLNKINELDKENIKKLNSFEQELKSKENEIKSKKNIISDQEFEKEINNFKKKIS